ncbi:MAG: hypothetical protein O2901_05750, partial [Verrucomicrobia bacterium]|nr:hypothetical protein [Verrucomicrobiota bacterium]
MTEVMVVQGREVTAADIELIRVLLAAHPTRGRTPLSEDLCRRWEWRLSACGTHRQATRGANSRTWPVARLFNGLLAHEHYLGHRNTVGDLPAGRQGTCVTWRATGTAARWPAPCSARPACACTHADRRRGSARTATPSWAGIVRRANVT